MIFKACSIKGKLYNANLENVSESQLEVNENNGSKNENHTLDCSIFLKALALCHEARPVNGLLSFVLFINFSL